MSLLLRRLWVQITADRKRFAALCVMVVIGLLLWSRIILINNTPRTAIADPAARKAMTASETADATASSRKPSTAHIPVSSHNSGEPAVEVHLASTPVRDPFRISPQHFPRPTIDQGNAKQAGKSDPPVADDPSRAVQRHEAQVTALAQKFVLEAVMHGASMAVINGKVHRKGDAVPAVEDQSVLFTLTSVGRTSVVLECNGLKFTLELSTPRIEQ